MRWIGVFAAFCLFLATARAETIPIGGIFPLTGPVAATGERQARGLRFAIDRLNAMGGVRGHRLALSLADSLGRPDAAIVVLEALRARHGVRIVVAGWSGPVLALAPLATKYNILLLNAGARADRLSVASPYLFNLVPPVSADVAAMTRYLAASGIRNVALLSENTAAGISGRDDFEDSFAGSGGTIVARETMFYGDTDFRAALTRLAAARPRTIVVSATSGLAGIAHAYRALGLTIPILGIAAFQSPDLVSNPDADGFAHARLRLEVPSDIAASYEAAFGEAMDAGARQTWRATQVLAVALDRVLAEGHAPAGDTMRAAILDIRTFPGPLVSRTQTAESPVDIAVIRGGRDVVLSDRPPPDSPAPRDGR